MNLLNFFKSPWRVVKLKLEIEHKNRQIGGHKAYNTRLCKTIDDLYKQLDGLIVQPKEAA